MTNDEIYQLCGRLRFAAAQSLPCDLADVLEAFAIVTAEIAHDWPKTDGATAADVLSVYHERARRYAARMGAH